MTTFKNQKIVFAPDYFNYQRTNKPISVTLEENEEIQWTWAIDEKGESYVSGYTIIKK